MATCGTSASFAVVPNDCYRIANVIVDGAPQERSARTFANVQAAHTIAASFVFRTHVLSVVAGAGGSVTPGTAIVSCGASAPFSIVAAACFTVANVVVDGVSVGAVSGYTFANVHADHARGVVRPRGGSPP